MSKINQDLVNQAIKKAQAAMDQFVAEWRLKHVEYYRDMCGYAYVSGLCGRKRTLVKMLKNAGVEVRKGYNPYDKNIIRIKPTVLWSDIQSITYHEKLMEVAAKSLNDSLGLDLTTNSYAD